MIGDCDPLDNLRVVAARLGPLIDQVVFLGGAVVGLLVTDRGASPPRVTLDVDVIIHVSRKMESIGDLSKKLLDLGWSQDNEKGAPICRWAIAGIKVDIMPTDVAILGFSNRWYQEAMRSADSLPIEGGLTIRVVSAPCFLATKIEAFHGRGSGDYLGSHDNHRMLIAAHGRFAPIRKGAQQNAVERQATAPNY